MDAGLRVRVALHANSLARTFACAGVGAGSLTTHGKPAQMPDAPVALDGLKALEIQAEFAAQIAFNDILALLNRVDDLRELLLVEILGADGRVDAGLLEDDDRVGRADAVNVAEGDVDSLLARDFNTNDACHSCLTLPLFVPRVRADDTNDAFALDDFAILAKLFYGCPNFHVSKLSSFFV